MSIYMNKFEIVKAILRENGNKGNLINHCLMLAKNAQYAKSHNKNWILGQCSITNIESEVLAVNLAKIFDCNKTTKRLIHWLVRR